jgi:O-antigen ligase
MPNGESRPQPCARPPLRERVDLGLLTALLVLGVAIPAALVFGPLGGAGTPSEMLGLGMFLVWLFRRVASHSGAGSTTSVSFALGLFVASVLLSYIAAATRPIDALELRGADRSVLSAIAWAGMALFIMDGLPSLNALDTFLRRLTFAGAFEASVGILQFFTHESLVKYIQIPGLAVNGEITEALVTRGTETRPPGTTNTPIEFGTVLTMILPIALHYALVDKHRSKVRRWLPVVLMAYALPISISRTTIISAAVALAILLPTYEAKLRRRAYAAIATLAVCVYMTIPGLLSTLSTMFTGISTDSSAKSRTESYALAEMLIGRSPILGRGYGTFLPKYRIFDNQVLLTAIQGGLIGVAVLLALVLTPIVACLRARRMSQDVRIRKLAPSVAAGVGAGAASLLFYDTFAFAMGTGILFIMIGCAGAVVKLSRTSAKAAAERESTSGTDSAWRQDETPIEIGLERKLPRVSVRRPVG